MNITPFAVGAGTVGAMSQNWKHGLTFAWMNRSTRKLLSSIIEVYNINGNALI